MPYHIKSLNVISHHIVSHHIILYCITWDQIRSDQIRAEQLRSYEITSYCIESDRVLLYHIKQSPVNSYINKSHHSTRSVVELKSHERHIQYAHTINLSIHTWEFRQSWNRCSNISHSVPLKLYTSQWYCRCWRRCQCRCWCGCLHNIKERDHYFVVHNSLNNHEYFIY